MLKIIETLMGKKTQETRKSAFQEGSLDYTVESLDQMTARLLRQNQATLDQFNADMARQMTSRND